MNKRRTEFLPLITAMVALAILVIGCGGGSSSSSAGTTAERPPGAASAEFLKPKGTNNGFVRFGTEAPAAEREAAGKVLEENLVARGEADFTTQCATLDAATVNEIVGQSARGDVKAKCPQSLKVMAAPLKKTAKARADNLEGSIAVLRMKGNKGYALYHGTNHIDYAMLMVKEDGQWKVGALLASELN